MWILCPVPSYVDGMHCLSLGRIYLLSIIIVRFIWLGGLAEEVYLRTRLVDWIISSRIVVK